MVPSAKTDADKLILEKLETAIPLITKNLDSFNLHEAAQTAYQFAWHDLADIYLEESKTQLRDTELAESTRVILAHCLVKTLKLLHPFTPFITEVLWGKLPTKNKKLLMVESW